MVNGGCFVADNLQLNEGVQLHEDTRMQLEYELTNEQAKLQRVGIWSEMRFSETMGV